MISAIPERIIEETLKRGFASIRANAKTLATVFQNLTEPEFRKIAGFIVKTPINISLNYPRQKMVTPAICILLKHEKESLPFLGDQMGYDFANSSEFAEHAIYESTVPSPLGGPAVKLVEPFTLRGVNAAGRLYLEYEDYVAIREAVTSVQNVSLYVVGGKGKGKVFSVKSIESEGYIEVLGDGTVLDQTSVVDLRAAAGGAAIGEPQPVFNQKSLLTRKGALFETTITLDILAASQEEVAYLYYITKAILYINKQFLEGQGIINLNISGEDMLVRAEFIPDEIFHRVLSLSFNNPFSILTEDDIIREFQLELC